MTLTTPTVVPARNERTTECEPWSYRREVWLRWLEHHRARWRLSATARTAHAQRMAAQFKPRPHQYANQGNFYSYRYHEARRLFLISQEDTAIYETIMVGHILKSHDACMLAKWPYDTWFQHYETPELTLDRHRAYLSGKGVRYFILSAQHSDVPLYHEFAGPGPRWIMHDDHGNMLLDPKTGRPTPMFAGGAGAEYFISPTGSDSNPGTEALPWLTFQKFLTAPSVVSGDILTMLAGTYTIAMTVNSAAQNNGTALARTILRPKAGASVLISASGGGFAVIDFTGGTPTGFQNQYWEVGRTGTVLRITNPALGTPNPALVVSRECSHHIRLRNLELFGNRGYALADGSINKDITSMFNEYLDLNGHDCGYLANPIGSTNSHGFYIHGNDELVEGCQIWNSQGYGLHLNTSTGTVTTQIFREVVRRGKFYKNALKQVAVEGGPTATNGVVSGFTDAALYNNLFYRCTTWTSGGDPGARDGLTIGSSSSFRTLVYNNTFAFNPAVGLRIHQGFTNPNAFDTVVRNNVSFGNSSGNYLDLGQGTVASHNAFSTTSPNWANAASDDYHLTAASATCLDLGTPLALVTEDFDGVARANPPDIGPYELGGGGSTLLTKSATEALAVKLAEAVSLGINDFVPPAAPTGLRIL